MTAVPFTDVALFNRDPTLRTVFHTLVHVTQFRIVGMKRVMQGYFQTLNESGLWMVVPFEEQAYQMNARFTIPIPLAILLLLTEWLSSYFRRYNCDF